MFKKLKDKLAEEVKSSPQRIQQFAQAAQAAVTSASSSISDITNSDLFSIGDNVENQNSLGNAVVESSSNKKSIFEDISLAHNSSVQSMSESIDNVSTSASRAIDSSRQRKLSNSSLASDVSFRLPSYESPSMYHLQSDMEISASEAEERRFSGSSVNLDRVTKEQLYAVYKRTQERYSKYRTQYADLARHYKLLEKENAKAKSVLVETQDKALRRISELKEQCSLEQSAKAHLERALRVELEEKNIKIDTLSAKIKLLQQNENNTDDSKSENNGTTKEAQLIDLSTADNINPQMSNIKELKPSEINILNNKIEKMDQLLNKYKDSLKLSKEKNAQLIIELQILSTEVENKSKEIEELKTNTIHLTRANEKIKELNDKNEELQNKINSYDFSKSKEISSLELDLQNAQEEIIQLHGQIEIFNKREEENAISLAENKLRIHEELESKENVIKSLKDNLTATQKEIKSMNIIVNDYKLRLSSLEEERAKLKEEVTEFDLSKTKITQLESKIQELTQKCQTMENIKSKLDEENRCLLLQVKQETAEKLAMVDRNDYLSKRNAQLIEETERKNSQIRNLQVEIESMKSKETTDGLELSECFSKEKLKILEEVEFWKKKCNMLESEIQEERDELVKLQADIENLLSNHELIQKENSKLHENLKKLRSENTELLLKIHNNQKNIFSYCKEVLGQIKVFRDVVNVTGKEMSSLQELNNDMSTITVKINYLLRSMSSMSQAEFDFEKLNNDYLINQKELISLKEQYREALDRLTKQNEDNETLKSNLRDKESNNILLRKQLNNINQQHDSCLNELSQFTQIKDNFEKMESGYSESMKDLKDFKEKHSLIVEELTNLKEENEKLRSNVLDYKTNLIVSKEKIENVTNLYESTINELKHFKNENIEIVKKLEDTEKRCESLEDELKQNRDKYMITVDRMSTADKENQNLKFELIEYKNENTALSKKIDELKDQNDDYINKFNMLENNNEELLQNKTKQIEHENENIALRKKIDELKDALHKKNEEILDNREKLNDKILQIKNLEEKNKKLSEEYISLKDQSEIIRENVKDLETELKELRVLHKDMEIEKNHLNSVITTLELNEQNRSSSDKMINIDNVEFTAAEYSERYNDMKKDHDALKDENRRLQSDIEGLQSYLRKISKENSTLNDKLRDSIASIESNPEKNGIQSQDLVDLNKELQLGKDKIDNLVRENTVLVEENFELKDQLQSQNYNAVKTSSNKTEEFINLQKQYRELLETKDTLEKKLSDLDSLNASVTRNMQHMHENNEKLRVSNEKLGRRLDEALVSLRHLHSLQENTELEYLRNILYEYLTGSGEHSLTLAKVLSAVVKFDDSQTRLVMTKVKERQGLMRQLGLT